MKQVKILMVCLGNICRSPLAQGILENKVDPKKVSVDSAGTAAYHQGNSPDPRSIAIAQKNGIDISHQKARQFTKHDFSIFSRIYVMDLSNYQNIIAIAENDYERAKVHFILNHHEEVPDPYYGNEDGFKNCYELLDNACNRIVKSLN